MTASLTGAFRCRLQAASILQLTSSPARHMSSLVGSSTFGIMFDIDGVIVRGKKVLPSAPEAFQLLVDKRTNKLRIPAIFLTNAGNSMRIEKAEKLSEMLKVHITEEQIVMAHSPLKMFSEYHKKHVLVVGQGPVEQIARSLGFTRVTTMDRLRHAFPALDNVDHKRRRHAPCSFEKYFPNIEAVVLFGEPVRWETSLQLIVDVLMTDGLPADAPSIINHPHLPVLACNMDLHWMAEAVMPRFGHGAFLLCLENLYAKVTGRDLVYTALIGKPSEITYRHGEHVLQDEARKLGITEPLKHIYCIGDNICTDIFGANLYNKYLQRRIVDRAVLSQREVENVSQSSRSIDKLIGADRDLYLSGAVACYSVLVETGVYSREGGTPVSLSHSPRDFLPVESSYQEPSLTSTCVLHAVESIFDREK